jgi:enoyl-CoA hydratase/carnithine racemase
VNLVLTEQPIPHLRIVSLNNPARLNALGMEMVGLLHHTLDELAESDCRVVILTGAGRGFCSGLDLSEPAVAPSARDRNGPAAGMRTQEFVASLVPKLVGVTRAADLIFTARRLGAEEAERIGLVSEVVADGHLLTRAREIADVLLAYSPFGLEMTKQVFRANQDAANVTAAIALENRTQILSASQLFATSGKTFADAVGAPGKEAGDEL